MPLVSVIVPVYKVEKYLARCVESVLAQTFTDFELILIDDGSPDNCPALCDEYAKKDARIHVIHQKNGGLSAARNAGIDWAFANSSSEWFFFVDSDDWIHPKTLELMLDANLKNGTEISICNFEETEGKSPVVDTVKIQYLLWPVDTIFAEHARYPVTAWNKLYKKELFRNVRYPVGRIHEDEFTTHKLLCQCEKVSAITEPLYAYYVNNDGITKSSWSIRHLDALVARRAQLKFFRLHNCKSNYVTVFKWYCYNVSVCLEKIAEDRSFLRWKIKFMLKMEFLKSISFVKFACWDNNRETAAGLFPVLYPFFCRVRSNLISRFTSKKGS